jgi:hypothetical protein
MIDFNKVTAAIPTLVLGALLMGSVVVSAISYGDDTPPESAGGAPGRHNNPAWAACKKQADDQKMQPGEARHEFMKTCMKSGNPAPVPAKP